MRSRTQPPRHFLLTESQRSLLIVNYRSASLTAEAIRSARASSSVPLQVVVVDNSVDEGELSLLRDVGFDELIRAPENRGYAGGINLGLVACQSDQLIIANPDVVFGDQCIDLLFAQTDNGAAISGPAFFWDKEHRWFLPPADRPSWGGKFDELIAARSSRWAQRRGRRRFARRIAFWSLERPTRVDALSGAVMCTRKSWIEKMGGFDERYKLYFEEIDLMTRGQAAGHSMIYVPEAHCRHLYNQSAALAPGTDERYAESEIEYYRKWVGQSSLMLMRVMGGALPAPDVPFVPLGDGRVPMDLPPRDLVVEASPLSSFDSAAGCFPFDPEVEFPRSIRASYRGNELFIRVVRRSDGEVLRRFVLRSEGD